MTHAIAELDRVADNAMRNAPVWDLEGNEQQASLCREIADECSRAVNILEAIMDGYSKETE